MYFVKFIGVYFLKEKLMYLKCLKGLKLILKMRVLGRLSQ